MVSPLDCPGADQVTVSVPFPKVLTRYFALRNRDLATHVIWVRFKLSLKLKGSSDLDLQLSVKWFHLSTLSSSFSVGEWTLVRQH